MPDPSVPLEPSKGAALVQVALSSVHPPKLAEFYRGLFGMQVLFEAGPMIFLGAGGVRLMIGPLAEGQEVSPGHGVILYFEPPDWATTEARCEAAGVKFLRPAEVLQRDGERELALRAFRDPEGRALALLGWRPAA